MFRAIGWLPLFHGVFLLAYLAARWLVSAALPDGTVGGIWVRPYALVALLNEFTPFLFAPLPLWLLTAAIARTRIALALAAVPWLLFAALYGEEFVPRPAQFQALARSPDEFARLRLLTLNLMSYTRPLDATVQAVLEADPDIVVVQELSEGFARELEPSLGAAYPYRALHPAYGPLGAGAWSRYPITSEELWDGSSRAARWQYLLLDVNGRPLHLVNLHLSSPTPFRRPALTGLVSLYIGEDAAARRREVASLVPRLRTLAEGSEPLVVAGDLNLTDQTPDYARLRDAGLGDAHRGVGWGFGHTFPSDAGFRIFHQQVTVPVPLLRIDHVLHSSRVVPLDIRVWPTSGGSDHLPVVADLALLP